MSEQRRIGRILTNEGWVSGQLVYDSHFRAVETGAVAADAPRIIPGFVDLHVPGGGGADVMEAGDAVRTVARLHARHGTTSFLPATITAARDDLEDALSAIGLAQAERGEHEARVLGAHMEGPYINPERLGAQPPHAREPEPDFVDAVCAAGIVKLVTLAPEVPGGIDAIRRLASAGIAVQIGHTDTDYETACAALEAGASGFTHLFNAMSPLHHRAPGATGAALARAQYAAIIPDGTHVADGALLAALRAIPKLFAVTDATAAAGMPDGDYPLGEHTVTKRGDGVYLGEDTLAGSALTMDRAFARLRGLGLPLEDVSRRLSTYPADFIGRWDRGRIATGAWGRFHRAGRRGAHLGGGDRGRRGLRCPENRAYSQLSTIRTGSSPRSSAARRSRRPKSVSMALPGVPSEPGSQAKSDGGRAARPAGGHRASGGTAAAPCVARARFRAGPPRCGVSARRVIIAGIARNPEFHEFTASDSAALSSPGAETLRNESAVPRPSLMLVASSRTSPA